MSTAFHILIIDDDQIVHKLLTSWLVKAGFEVISVLNGMDGIAKAKEKKPDIILLDVMMPQMDGFEVCRRLNEDHDTSKIPVIFLSAKTESEDKVHGLELGAVDYINKPFDLNEVLARINTQIKLKKQEEQLENYAQNLEEMVRERTEQLIHVGRLASLGTLSAGIAHEINNPITFILGNLQTMEQFWKDLLPYIEELIKKEPNPKLDFIIKEIPEMIEAMGKGSRRITKIVSGLKSFSRRDSSEKSMVDVNQSLMEAIELTRNNVKYWMNVETDLEEDIPPIWGGAQQLTQVFVNLIINAADAISQQEGNLRITSKSKGDSVELTFADNGSGIPAEIISQIFDPFFTTKAVGKGTGLGLSISHGIIEDHKGDIQVTSNKEKGSTFVITFPITTESSHEPGQ